MVKYDISCDAKIIFYSRVLSPPRVVGRYPKKGDVAMCLMQCKCSSDVVLRVNTDATGPKATSNSTWLEPNLYKHRKRALAD